MFRFTGTRLYESSSRAVRMLDGNLPLTGESIASLTDPDGDAWFWAILDTPMTYRVPSGISAGSGTSFSEITEVVLRPHYCGEMPSPGMRNFPMDLAVVLNPDMRQSGAIDPNQLDFIAVVEVDGGESTRLSSADGWAPDIQSPTAEHRTTAKPLAADPVPSAAGTKAVPAPSPSSGLKSPGGRSGTASPATAPPGMQPLPQAQCFEPFPPTRDHAPRPRAEVEEPIRAAIVGPDPRSRRPLVLAAGAAALLAASVMGFWALQQGSDEAPAAATPTRSLAPPPSVDASPSPQSTPRAQRPEDVAKVIEMLPPGFRPGTCSAADTVDGGGVATLVCGPNADPGGPQSASYTLYPSQAALDGAFDAVVRRSRQLVCPGNIQSPGDWRRKASPQKAAGILFCGNQNGQSTIIWTDTDRLLLSSVQSSPSEAALEALYKWWTQNS